MAFSWTKRMGWVTKNPNAGSPCGLLACRCAWCRGRASLVAPWLSSKGPGHSAGKQRQKKKNKVRNGRARRSPPVLSSSYVKQERRCFKPLKPYLSPERHGVHLFVAKELFPMEASSPEAAPAGPSDHPRTGGIAAASKPGPVRRAGG